MERAAAARLSNGAPVWICGVDEAGRGPLAGPVLAAAVAFRPGVDAVREIPRLEGLNDSKQLSAERRDALFSALTDAARVGALALSAAAASVTEIEARNILRANDLAMRRAVERLGARPALALIDGSRTPPGLCCPAEAIVKGDARSVSIAAASIIAKVLRDRIMIRLARRWPGYGWERNAGYPTTAHRQALERLGPSPHHRGGFGSTPARIDRRRKRVV